MESHWDLILFGFRNLVINGSLHNLLVGNPRTNLAMILNAMKIAERGYIDRMVHFYFQLVLLQLRQTIMKPLLPILLLLGHGRLALNHHR